MRLFPPVLIALVFILSTAIFANGQTEAPKITGLKFGSITIDGKVWEKDVIIENGEVKKRDKDPSKFLRSKYNHTPLTEKENVPWDCDTLVIGTGVYGRLPVTDDFEAEAKKRNVTLIILETPEAAEFFMANYSNKVNAIFHITC